MFGRLNTAQIEKVISGNFIGRLGCHAEGKTYIVPVSYAYDGNCIYVHTYEGLKIRMMRQNPNVCFQIDKMDDMADWESVIAWGVFEELINEKERNAGLKLLSERILPQIASQTVKFSAQWPFPSSNFDHIKGIVFRICLNEKTGKYERIDPQIKG